MNLSEKLKKIESIITISWLVVFCFPLAATLSVIFHDLPLKFLEISLKIFINYSIIVVLIKIGLNYKIKKLKK